MNELFPRLLIKNWPRKAVALLTAIFTWFLINHTITITRTIPDVPVRIINVAPDKTVVGLLSNGLLSKRIALTFKGRKSALADLRASDIEVIINAEGHKESWIATITKKNLVSLNHEVDLHKHITEVEAHDLFIKLSKLVSEEITVTITKPIGDPPKGYQYLDVWPKYLLQKVSGPEEQVRELKHKGLELTFNLNRISLEELNALYAHQREEEISYPVPDAWKKVAIPFKDNALELLNDPRAETLNLVFLKQELIFLGTELPITLFFPLQYSQTLNPQNYSLETDGLIREKNGLTRLTLPLFVQDVSQLFLDVVRDNLLLIVVVAPETTGQKLHWAIEFIDEKALEERYVQAFFQHLDEKYSEESFTKYSEQAIRERFRDYLRRLTLYTQEGKSLQLDVEWRPHTVQIIQTN